jgi:hypothetical protein
VELATIGASSTIVYIGGVAGSPEACPTPAASTAAKHSFGSILYNTGLLL